MRGNIENGESFCVCVLFISIKVEMKRGNSPKR
jgi:hypothetical protein